MACLNTGENTNRKEAGAVLADTTTHSSGDFPASCGVWLAGALSSESHHKENTICSLLGSSQCLCLTSSLTMAKGKVLPKLQPNQW